LKAAARQQVARRCQARVAQPGAARPSRSQGRLGPMGVHLALVLGDGGQHVRRQPVHVAQICGDEIHSESDSAGEATLQVGDNVSRLMLSSRPECLAAPDIYGGLHRRAI